MPAIKKDKTGLTDITVRNVNKKTWKAFDALCESIESDRSSQIRLYVKKCVEGNEIK